jgi:metal-dependent amidase/aminoacylase/carboxypeptidase family protein
MVTNLPLARALGRHLAQLGRTPRERDPRVGAGSTDMGDVSHAVPSIHPWLAICDENVANCHQRAFAACAASDRGMETMLVAAKAMARCGADFLRDPALRAEVRAEFEGRED